ncbi:hypothetical protein [Candidatus Cyanaurora vandensis]|nr:hypothetical protein [Candidatus Cyanaurora vandensis]
MNELYALWVFQENIMLGSPITCTQFGSNANQPVFVFDFHTFKHSCKG